jgi:hypothetical protein
VFGSEVELWVEEETEKVLRRDRLGQYKVLAKKSQVSGSSGIVDRDQAKDGLLKVST